MIRGFVAGQNAFERAVRFAGALAELGCTRLEFQSPGNGSRTLLARETDLPGVVADAPSGSTLRWNSVCAVIHSEELRWECSERDLGKLLAVALNDSV